jgi:hypothetical protein
MDGRDMSMKENKSAETSASKSDRRRSRRLVLTVPVALEWKNNSGKIMNELATAREVSLHGASLHFSEGRRTPSLNQEVTIKSAFSGEVIQARVARARRLASGRMDNIAIEILSPSPTFWGLTFQLQQTMSQLLDIENACQASMKDVDFRVLRSLSEAVKQIRSVASIVQEWQELQVARKNTYSVLDALSSARLRKASELLLDITTDIDSNELSPYAEDFAEFSRAVNRLYDRMKNGRPVFHGA